MTSRYKFFLLSVLIFSVTTKPHKIKTLSPQDVSQVERLSQQFQESPSDRLLQIISGAQIAAFSKASLVASGLDPNEVKNWNLLFEAGIKFAVKQSDVSLQLRDYLRLLKEISTHMQVVINDLHNRFSTAFSKETVTFGGEVTFDPKKINLTPKDRKALEDTRKKLLENREKALKTSVFAWELMSNTTKYPPGWTQKLYKTKFLIKTRLTESEVFKQYKHSNNDWKKLFDDHESMSFDNFLKQYKINNEKDALSLTDLLDSIRYIQTEKLKKEKKQKVIEERKEISRICIAIKRRLKQKYPEMISPLEMQQFSITENKMTALLIAFSGPLATVIKILLMEIDKILSATKQELIYNTQKFFK